MIYRNTGRIWLTRLLVVLGTLSVCTGILEIGLRVFGQSPTNMTDGFFEQHGDSFLLKKNMTKVTRWPGYSYTVYTNHYGFRDQNPGNHDIEGTRYVLYLGASQTFGNGVEYEDSFVGIMAERLRRKKIHTLNLAIGGAHLGEQFQLLYNFTTSVSTKPETVFICLDPLMISKFDTEHEEFIVKGGYVFNRDRWILPYLKIMISNRSAAYCFFRDRIRRLQVRYGKKSNIDGDFYYNLYSIENRIRSSAIQNEFGRALDSLVQYVRSLGAEPVCLYIPTIASLTIKEMAVRAGYNPNWYDPFFYSALIDSYCRKKNIRYVNPHQLLMEYQKKGRDLSFTLDAHYNQFTNEKIANFIYKALFSDTLTNESQ